MSKEFTGYAQEKAKKSRIARVVENLQTTMTKMNIRKKGKEKKRKETSRI